MKVNVSKTTSLGIATNVAAGHAAEMSGAAVLAAGKSTGCPVAQAAGKAMQAAGKAYASTAVKVGTRDARKL